MTAKEFLDGELKKYNNYNQLQKAHNNPIRSFFDKFSFDRIKKIGVGQTTILKFLGGELTKCESWEDLNKSIKILFPTEHSFTQTKTHGVGQTTILKFLGGNWKAV